MGKLYSRALPLLLILICVTASNVPIGARLFAYVPLSNKEEKLEWETYTSKGEEFSVQMPELPGVIETTTCVDAPPPCEINRLDRTYAAYAEGVVFMVTSYENPNHRQSLKQIIAGRLETFSSEYLDVTPQGKTTLNKFPGESFGLKSKSGLNGMARFYLTKGHVYEIAVRTQDLSAPLIEKFFESFKLGSSEGKEIGNGTHNAAASSTALPVPKASPASPKVINQGGGGRGADGPADVFKPNEVTRKAVIIVKPSPEYTEEARKNQIDGTVTLQMVLSSSGKVMSIRTISGLSHGLTEKAIGAARKIYFLPAVKDGKRVSQYIRVEYNFSIY